MRRRSIAAGVTGCLVAAFVLGGASAASAADGPYNIDGNIPDTTPATTELIDPYGSGPTGKELGPVNSNTTKIGVIHNDALPTLDYTNPNGQVDLRRAWLDTERDTAAPNHDWLYFAWERDANSGSGFIAYEFMQKAAPAGCAYDTASEADLIANCNPWANRDGDTDGDGPDIGDFMILWDQQGGSKDLYLRTWMGTAPNLTLGAPDLLDSAVSQAAYSADGFRGEAAVDLTATIFGGSTACKSFANTIPSTVTGNSDTADYKDTILKNAPPITNCAASIVTTPKDGAGATIPAGDTNVPGPDLSIGTGIVAVKDSALVGVTGGTATPSGSVAFFLCKVDTADAVCGSGGTSVGSTNLTGTVYPVTVVSPTAYVTSAGRYCWRATFSGDSANGIAGKTDSSSGECFSVTPVTPVLATTAGDDVLLGNAVTDTANLTGLATQPASPVINLTNTAGAAAGGTVTFKLYKAPAIPGGSACGTLVYTSTPVAIVTGQQAGTASATASYTPTSAGSYHWVAEYSGNLPNNNATSHNGGCTDTNEDVSVTSVPSSLTSAQRWVPNDSVTITVPPNTGALAGNVDFELYTNATCDGTPVYTLLNVAVTAAEPTASSANATAFTATGSFSWRVNYDSTNDAQRDIDWTCHETSALTVTNGGTVSSTP